MNKWFHFLLNFLHKLAIDILMLTCDLYKLTLSMQFCTQYQIILGHVDSLLQGWGIRSTFTMEIPQFYAKLLSVMHSYTTGREYCRK